MAYSQSIDSELVTFNFIRNHYERKYKQNVPMALKYLALQFSKRIIGCKLLTIKQDMDFFDLLSTTFPSIRKFNFLFRASDHQFSAKKFHEHCDDKGCTLTIIKSNHGNIFGGYTSKSWKSDRLTTSKSDRRAFLFLIKSNDESIQIKCPLLLRLPIYGYKPKHAIYCLNQNGPVFGNGFDIVIRDKCNKKVDKHEKECWKRKRNNNYSLQDTYGKLNSELNICGGTRDEKDGTSYFQVIDYEVFQIINN